MLEFFNNYYGAMYVNIKYIHRSILTKSNQSYLKQLEWVKLKIFNII